MPFNKTNQEVKLAIEKLEKAQQDVNNYECESEPEINNNGKRSVAFGEGNKVLSKDNNK